MSKNVKPLAEQPRFIEAQALHAKLCKQQRDCTDRMVELQILVRDEVAESDHLVTTLAALESSGPGALRDELVECNRRSSLLQQATSESARRIEMVRRQLTVEYLLAQRAPYVKALSVLIDALRTVVNAEKPFTAMKDDAAALGYSVDDSGVLPINIWKPFAEWAEGRLPGLEKDLGEHEDAIDPTLDERTESMRMLRDEQIGQRRLEAGETYELSARVARRLHRDHAAELAGNGAASPARVRALRRP